MKKGIWRIWLALVVSLVILAPASATIITVEVEGVVDSVETGGGFELDGSVSVGVPMTGYCTYDTDTPDLYTSENHGLYELISISMTVGNYTFTHDSTSPDSALFDVGMGDTYGYAVYNAAPRFEGMIIVDGMPQTYDDITWGYTRMGPFALVTSSSEYITTDALPISFPDLSVFDIGHGIGADFYEPYYSNGYFGIYGEVTSLTVIPEPATVFLLTLGGLALLRKRNGKRKIKGTESRFCASY